MPNIRDNIRQIMGKIQATAVRAGRKADEVGLVAITKTVPVERMAQAIDAGITDIGENKVQEAETKWSALDRTIPWHLVGHLQTNKVKKAVKMFDLIHSVDSERLAGEINQAAAALHKVQSVLLQVNTSGEESKYGMAPDQVLDQITRIMLFKNIAVKGLMTMGAWLPDSEQVRPCFKRLKSIQEQIISRNLPGVSMAHLSMGMTGDFVVAIEEGATMVRIGRGIFGERTV